MKLRNLVLTAACLGLPACSLIPEYERPIAPIQTQWPVGSAYAVTADAPTRLAQPGWKEFFRDPALQQLISLALGNNRDLREAALNVEAYRALHRIQRSERFPTIDAGANGNRQRVPADLSTTSDTQIQSQYDVSVGISYELDAFGRLKSLEHSALEKYLATEQAQRSVQIALIGDVSTAYLTWRTDQEKLELTSSTLDSYTQSLALIESSAATGTASALDVRQARSLVDQARADKSRYLRLVAQDVNGLQLLLGADVPRDLVKWVALDDQVIADLPSGLPAEVLQQRPDIRAAEHQLLAANADIGAARAAFFPSVRLTAGAGTASSDLDGLFSGGSGIWSFSPQISVPIFNAGRLKANLDYSKVQKDINIARYERSIQNAFREVADGLAARGTYGTQLQAQRDLVNNNLEYFQLARERYDAGIDNYLVVLDAQRELFSARQQLLSEHLGQLNSEVTLYRALGGGLTGNVL